MYIVAVVAYNSKQLKEAFNVFIENNKKRIRYTNHHRQVVVYKDATIFMFYTEQELLRSDKIKGIKVDQVLLYDNPYCGNEPLFKEFLVNSCVPQDYQILEYGGK